MANELLTDEAINMIMQFESFSAIWYADPVLGWKTPTVMYGHTDSAGNPKYQDTKNRVFTKEEGRITLINDLSKYGQSITRLVRSPLTKNKYGALLSLVYNIGTTNFSTSTLLKKLNARDYIGAADEFEKWHKSGGKIIEGLCNRREIEYQMFIRE